LANTKAQHIDFMTNVHKANQFEIEKLKSENDKLKGEYDNFKTETQAQLDSKAKELDELTGKLEISEICKEEISTLKKSIEELNNTIISLTTEKENLRKKNEEIAMLLNDKEKKIAV
jgi:hypothetical protein